MKAIPLEQSQTIQNACCVYQSNHLPIILLPLGRVVDIVYRTVRTFVLS